VIDGEADLSWEYDARGVDGAAFSKDRRYRYRLWRSLRFNDRRVLFCGLNPSKAGATQNDMTITKCVGFANRGFTCFRPFGLVDVVNLNAIIETDSEVMRAMPALDAMGPRNEEAILDALRLAKDAHGSLVIAAWGSGVSPTQVMEFQNLLRIACVERVYCLGRTKDGSPRHPSRIAYTTPLETWWEA
jgi:hypothetical protein